MLTQTKGDPFTRYTFAPPQPDDSAASLVHFRTAAYTYVAHNNRLSDQVVRYLVEVHFNIKDIYAIPRSNFEDVIRYLVDFNPHAKIN